MTTPLPSADASLALCEQVREAIAHQRPLHIQGAGSKAFLGRPVAGERIDTRAHRGIVHYDPTELVITARAGTPLTELVSALEEQGQWLPCDPPRFGEQHHAADGCVAHDGHGDTRQPPPSALSAADDTGAPASPPQHHAHPLATGTVGGMIATGLSGPSRPWTGSVRDFVLGTRLITGLGQHLRFGGEVMKNVAGYDISRLLAGSFGSLGLITEVSLKVLPRPRHSASLRLELPLAQALAALTDWNRHALPITAALHDGTALHVRLEGGEGSVQAACTLLGGEAMDARFWASLRDHQLPFFDDPRPLWRLSLPENTPVLALPAASPPADWLIDWGGAQRWVKTEASAEELRTLAASVGGHATCYTAGITPQPFHPLPDALLRYHRQLKARMDPHALFNPGRLYDDTL